METIKRQAGTVLMVVWLRGYSSCLRVWPTACTGCTSALACVVPAPLKSRYVTWGAIQVLYVFCRCRSCVLRWPYCCTTAFSPRSSSCSSWESSCASTSSRYFTSIAYETRPPWYSPRGVSVSRLSAGWVRFGSAGMSSRWGGMYNAHCVANFVRSLAVKEFRESINISRCYRHDKGVLFFWLRMYLFYYLFIKNRTRSTKVQSYANIGLYEPVASQNNWGLGHSLALPPPLHLQSDCGWLLAQMG